MAGKVIGVSDLAVAKIIQDNAYGIYYDVPYKFQKKLMKIGLNFANSAVNLEADDQTVDRQQSNSEIKVSIDVTDLTESEKAYLLGQYVGQGVRTRNNRDEAPYFCVMFKSKKNDNKYKYVKVLKVQFSEPNYEAESGGSSTKFHTPKLEGVGIQRIYDGDDIRVADESENGFNIVFGSKWFDVGDIGGTYAIVDAFSGMTSDIRVFDWKGAPYFALYHNNESISDVTSTSSYIRTSNYVFEDLSNLLVVLFNDSNGYQFAGAFSLVGDSQNGVGVLSYNGISVIEDFSELKPTEIKSKFLSKSDYWLTASDMINYKLADGIF